MYGEGNERQLCWEIENKAEDVGKNVCLILTLELPKERHISPFIQESQDGPGSLAWIFFVTFREELTRISLCKVQVDPIH